MPPTAPPVLGTTILGGSVFSQACRLLQLNAIPPALPCRDQQRDEIFDFLCEAVSTGTGKCLYISGVPGTGKTVTVHQVVRAMQELSRLGELPAFQFVEINGMKLVNPPQVYSLLWKGLTGAHATPAHAAEMLDQRFTTPSPHRQPCVLLVDELDLLVTRKQTVIYNLFDWPTHRHSRLVVIGIANTMDLPERMLPRVHSRLGLRRLDFQAYTREQLRMIIGSRLTSLDAYTSDAVEYCAIKIAAVSGDIRKALEICRRAAELAEAAKAPSVGMDHVNAALEELFRSTAVQTLQRACSMHEQLMVASLLLEIRRQGLPEVSFGDVAARQLTLCSTNALELPSHALLAGVAARLAEVRLILREGGSSDRFSKMRLNMAEEDVVFALTNNRIIQAIFDVQLKDRD